MKILKLCPFLLSVTLLGCNTTTQTISEPQVIAIEKNVQNDTVLAKSTNTKANSKSTVKKNAVKKTAPAIPQVPTVNKTTVKDVIVDGTGSLVFAKADGTFLSFAPVQGQRGEQGAKGDKGDQGEKGADGRGIDHCELDNNKNLVVYYTDGTSQNVGCVAVQSESKPYEQVGYELTSNSPYSGHKEKYDASYDYVVNVSVKLVSINNNMPSQKYHYKITVDYDFDNISNPNNYFYSVSSNVYIDNVSQLYDESIFRPYPYDISYSHITDTIEKDIYSSSPLVEITDYITDIVA